MEWVSAKTKEELTQKSILTFLIVSLITFFLFASIVKLKATVERQWDGRIYVSTDTLTMAWNASDGATLYHVQAVDELHTLATVYDLGTTTETSMTLTPPAITVLKYRVQACNEAGCSGWAESTDPTYAKVDGNPGAWRVLWKLGTPSGGGVE